MTRSFGGDPEAEEYSDEEGEGEEWIEEGLREGLAGKGVGEGQQLEVLAIELKSDEVLSDEF